MLSKMRTGMYSYVIVARMRLRPDWEIQIDSTNRHQSHSQALSSPSSRYHQRANHDLPDSFLQRAALKPNGPFQGVVRPIPAEHGQPAALLPSLADGATTALEKAFSAPGEGIRQHGISRSAARTKD
jgi:hypothetical protein